MIHRHLAIGMIALVPILSSVAVEDEGFTSLFNGQDLSGWVGDTEGYDVEDGVLFCIPEKGGNLFTEGSTATSCSDSNSG